MVIVTIDLTRGGEVIIDSTPIEIDSEDGAGPANTLLFDDSITSQNYIGTFSLYRYIEGYLQDYSAPDNPEVDINVFDRQVQGEKFDVNLVRNILLNLLFLPC